MGEILQDGIILNIEILIDQNKFKISDSNN